MSSFVPESLLEHLRSLRHDIHRHPELGFHEVRTRETVERELASCTDAVFTRMATTGLVVDIKGTNDQLAQSRPARCVALRADLDALDMTEENEHLPYRSQAESKAHMCGHDGHIVMLVGAATMLYQARDRIPSNCTVRLLFQPAEEGPGGAKVMVAEGCLEGVDEVYGIHNWPSIPLGEVRVCKGPIMAHIIDFDIKVDGRGGHGSQPHLCADPILPSCSIVQNINTILGRNIPSKESAVVVVTAIHSGTVNNVIPDSCLIKGSSRDFSAASASTITQRLEEIVHSTCKCFGVSGSLDVRDSYPVLVNTEAETDNVVRACSRVLGADKVSAKDLPVLASEDFSFFTRAKPGCFFFLGGQEAGRTNAICHSTQYDFNDHCIPLGVALWVRLVEDRFDAQLYD